MTEDDFLAAIDAAIVQASNKMDLGDLEDASDFQVEETQEERFHCGTCITNTVMETVWPSIHNYINFLKQASLHES